jgi:tricorn protease
MLHGHMVCLLDEDTASDGDQFAYVFQRAGLGELIGKRSWGGVVGIYGHGPLIDGGSVSVPEAGTADPEGRWVIEGHGVDPDIEVENAPQDVLAGRDAQLERAVEVVLRKLEADPRTFPERPADPVKTE